MEFKGTTGDFKDGYQGWRVRHLGDVNCMHPYEIVYSDDDECVVEIVHTKEDADLIAAAPDLFNVLLEYYNLESGNISKVTTTPMERLEMAKKALNKALGKQ